MRAELSTGTHRYRSYEEAHSLLGRRMYAYRERLTLSQNSELFFESIFWSFTFINSNT
jgi:hypothetical protein